MEKIVNNRRKKLIVEISENIINTYRHTHLRKYYGYRQVGKSVFKKRTLEVGKRLREVIPELTRNSFFNNDRLRFVIANACFSLDINSNPAIVLYTIYESTNNNKRILISEIADQTGLSRIQVQRAISDIRIQLNSIEPELGSRFLQHRREPIYVNDTLDHLEVSYILDLDCLYEV